MRFWGGNGDGDGDTLLYLCIGGKGRGKGGCKNFEVGRVLDSVGLVLGLSFFVGIWRVQDMVGLDVFGRKGYGDGEFRYAYGLLHELEFEIRLRFLGGGGLWRRVL